MRTLTVSDYLSLSGQVEINDLDGLKENGVTILVCNRPDGESDGQPSFADISTAALAKGIKAIDLPFRSGGQSVAQVDAFAKLMQQAQEQEKKIHAYCRTGNRSACLWAAASVKNNVPYSAVLSKAAELGYDVAEAVKPFIGDNDMQTTTSLHASTAMPTYDVVIVGAGSGGIALAASLLKRKKNLRIALVDPAQEHYYQPGWTMVGGGVFSDVQTKRHMRDLIPSGVSWVKQSVVAFSPSENTVTLDNGQSLHYQHLAVAPGLELYWDGIKGLKESLGSNGVTSNYSYIHAPYTWELVKGLKKGRAIFTQPPMPIKCAGAPQKALYLSADHWFRTGVLKDVNIDFYNSGGVLFGVAAYVPALQKYIDKYRARLHFSHTLVEVDGANKKAYFKKADSDEHICETFDMLHVCPPQRAPRFVSNSELADETGWLDVDQFTLQHKKFSNIWGVGDVMNTPNAKTMAAVRKQVPVVASNIVSSMEAQELEAGYDGYGSCPLTVERGKIVLAEFGYGGKLLPSFPSFMLDGTTATWRAWALKKSILPTVYWHAMLKGREWLASPKSLKSLKP